MRHLPNAISLLRLILLLPYTWYVFQPHSLWPAFWVAVAIIATDKLDGTLARRFHVESKTGEFLDSLADTAFVLLSWLFFYIQGLYGFELLILLLLPRPLSGIGYILHHRKTGTWDLSHLQVNRIAAVLNFAAILWILARLLYGVEILWGMAGVHMVLAVASVYLRVSKK